MQSHPKKTNNLTELVKGLILMFKGYTFTSMQDSTKLANAVSNRVQIFDIKQRYLSGQITREQAKLEAAPIIERINKRGAEIAKKWHRSYAPQSFIGLMR
jgi:hypothetical protein